MQTLMDELREDSQPRGQCATCHFIESRPPAEQKEWDAACVDRSFTHASIHRAMRRREAKVGRGSLENHRQNGHRAS